jgi:hypothetical protein
MKPWIQAVLVLVVLSVGTFTVLVPTTNHLGQHRVPNTPKNVRSYEAAVCDAAIRGLPHPPPLEFDDGTSMSMACDVNPL